MLLALVESYRGTLAWLQLCNPQHFFRHSCVCLPPRLPRPFAGSPVYVMSLSHSERLRAVGCGLKGKFVRMLLWVVYGHSQAHWNRRACHQIMLSIVRRVASKQMAAVRDDAAKAAEMLCASGQFAAAQVPLQRAIDFGDSNSLALKAWLLVNGREGVAEDRKRGFELAEKGSRLGCHHCQGVMAHCYLNSCGCEENLALSLELARESSGRGSKYGQFTLGELYRWGYAGLARDYAQALAFHRLAAAQGLDCAQYELGHLHFIGEGVARDDAEALRWSQLAAAQGHPYALYNVAECHEYGRGVRKSKAAAIRWYRRAQAAGHPDAADDLRRLRA